MDIKDSYLHGTVGVVKSINVNADELTYTLADKQGTQVKVTLPKATVTTNGVMSNSDKVKLDNLNIDYFSNIVSYKISLPDNSGRDSYILIAKLTSWIDGKNSDYGFIGRIVGYRGGNQLNTCCYNLVAMLSSYVYNNATIYVKQLYVDKHTGYLEALPYVVTYNGENYLALKKLGSGAEIYFEGAVKNVLPQSQWIVLNTPSGKSLPDNMTVLHSPNFTDAHSITTSKYFDGSSTKTLLHSGNHDGYTNKVKQNVTTSNASYPLLLAPSGQTATTTEQSYFDSGVALNPSTNTISANISGYAVQLKSGSKNSPKTAASVGLGASWYTLPSSGGYAGDNTGFPAPHNSNGILWLGCHSNESDPTKFGSGGQLGFSGNGNIYYRRTASQGSFADTVNGGSWKQIAYTSSDITGNAASAGKLKTARKLWGLDFDGSANVSGSLTGVTSINMDGDIVINDGTNKDRYIKFQYNNTDAFAWRIGYTGSKTGDDNDFIIQTSGANINETEFSNVLQLKPNKNAIFSASVTATTFIGNLNGTYVNKLTGYSKATTKGAITATDTLNVALGKLEFKADAAYDLVKGAYDGDGTIENLAEILKVLEGIKDTETIQAIIGKYLPLTGGTLTGKVTLASENFGPLVIYRKNNTNSASIQFKNGNDVSLGYIGMAIANAGLRRFSADTKASYKIWDEGNDGSGSGLDADMLDGKHALDFVDISSNLTVGGNKLFTNIVTTNKLHLANVGSNALSGMTNASLMYDSYTALNSASYHPILGVKTNGGNVVNLGAYINGVGFYGYKNGRTENGWDWKFIFDSANGNLETTGCITLHTTSGDSPALIFRRGSANDGLFDWSMKVSAGTLKFQLRETNGSWADVLSLRDSSNRNIVSAWHIIPDVTAGRNLGAESYKWANVYATNFKGTADNATLFDNSSKDNFFVYRGAFPSTFIDHTATNYKYENLKSGVYNNAVKDANGNALHGELIVHFSNGGSSASGLLLRTMYEHSARIFVRKNIDSNRVSGQWQPLAWYSDIPTKLSLLTNDIGVTAQKKETTIPAKAGWYRIASSSNGVSPCLGDFEIKGTISGYHTVTKLTANINYGYASGITVINSSSYMNSPALSKVRMVYKDKSWSGLYAYLEVYCPLNSAIKIHTSLVNGYGWTLLDAKETEAIPSGYTTKEVSLTNNTFTTTGNSSFAGDSLFAGPVTIKGYCLSITNTSGNQYILMGNQNGDGTNKPSIIRASNGCVYIGYGDDWSSSTGGTYNSICTFNPNGSVTANKFIGSLEGAASTATSLKSTTIIQSLTKELSNASWTDTGYTFASLTTGTYAIQVTSGTNLVASGIMSVYKNLEDTTGDEIPLHVYGNAGWRPYLRTYQNKLLISSNDNEVKSRTVTIKIAQIL